MNNIGLGQILYILIILGFLVALFSAVVYAYRARDNLLEIEKGRKPIYTEYCTGMFGLLGTRARGARVTIYDGLLVLKGEGEFIFEPDDIVNLEPSNNLFGECLKIKYRNRPYPPPMILLPKDREYLIDRIETGLHLKNNPNYGVEESILLPEKEGRERKRWFWLS